MTTGDPGRAARVSPADVGAAPVVPPAQVSCRMGVIARAAQGVVAVVATVSAIVSVHAGIAAVSVAAIAAVFFGMNAVTGSCPQGWFTGRRSDPVASAPMGYPRWHPGRAEATSSRRSNV